MKNVLSILAVIFLISFIANGQTLPPKIKAHLDRHYPKWKLGSKPRLTPCEGSPILSGDFDGNGTTDYSVAILKGRTFYYLAFLRSGQKYKASLLEKLEPIEDLDRDTAGVLVSEKKGAVFHSSHLASADRPVRLKKTGIGVRSCVGEGGVYYFENGRFKFIVYLD